MGQVQISTAFESPDLLQNCLSFLRQYAKDMGAHAACAVVPKKAIAYPQVTLVLCLGSNHTLHMLFPISAVRVDIMQIVPEQLKLSSYKPGFKV